MCYENWSQNIQNISEAFISFDSFPFVSNTKKLHNLLNWLFISQACIVLVCYLVWGLKGRQHIIRPGSHLLSETIESVIISVKDITWLKARVKHDYKLMWSFFSSNSTKNVKKLLDSFFFRYLDFKTDFTLEVCTEVVSLFVEPEYTCVVHVTYN